MEVSMKASRGMFEKLGMLTLSAAVSPILPTREFALSMFYGAHPVMTSRPIKFEEAPQVAAALRFLADEISKIVERPMSNFREGWISLAADVHDNAVKHGFWEQGEQRNDGEMLALIHSEISEALEAIRKGNPPDDKLPEFSGAETELADAVIRIMDMAHARGWQVAKAIEAKMAYNEGRPYKHGKEF